MLQTFITAAQHIGEDEAPFGADNRSSITVPSGTPHDVSIPTYCKSRDLLMGGSFVGNHSICSSAFPRQREHVCLRSLRSAHYCSFSSRTCTVVFVIGERICKLSNLTMSTLTAESFGRPGLYGCKLHHDDQLVTPSERGGGKPRTPEGSYL